MKKIDTFCPVRDILDRLGDKWSVLVILRLEGNEAVRFNELARSIPDISQKMLTVTLRNLEQMRLVRRTIYPEIPPRVEYCLTELGESLLVPMHSMIEWALEHKLECLENRHVSGRDA